MKSGRNEYILRKYFYVDVYLKCQIKIKVAQHENQENVFRWLTRKMLPKPRNGYRPNVAVRDCECSCRAEYGCMYKEPASMGDFSLNGRWAIYPVQYNR